MTPVASALYWGLPITLVVLVCVYLQRRAMMRPPADARQAELRAAVAMMLPMPHLGIRLSTDRFIYGPSGRCLGPLDGAKAEFAAPLTVTKVKPGHAWAVITFADGTEHRWMYPLRRQAEAAAQLARFQSYAAVTPAGQFRRTRPAGMAP